MKRLIQFAAFAAVLIVLFWTVGEAGATGRRVSSGCGYSSCATPTYYNNYYATPEVIYRDVVVPVAYPVPFTVAVPVVSYLYNGGGTYAPVFQAQPANMATVTTQQMQPGVVGLSDAQLDSIIERIEKRLQSRGAQPAAPNGNGNGNGNVGSPPPTVPSAQIGSVANILSRHCASCHTGTSAKKGIVIFEAKDVLSPNANRAAIWDASDAGRMPPEAQKDVRFALSDAEVAVLRAWMLGR